MGALFGTTQEGTETVAFRDTSSFHSPARRTCRGGGGSRWRSNERVSASPAPRSIASAHSSCPFSNATLGALRPWPSCRCSGSWASCVFPGFDVSFRARRLLVRVGKPGRARPQTRGPARGPCFAVGFPGRSRPLFGRTSTRAAVLLPPACFAGRHQLPRRSQIGLGQWCPSAADAWRATRASPGSG